MPRRNLPLRRFSLALTAALTSLALLGACKKGASETPTKAPPAPPIDVTSVAAVEESTPDVMTLTGTAIADERSEITADTQGKVLAVMVEIGQKVKMGDPLLRLDTRSAALGAREAQANLAAARAQRQLADDECKRAQTLLEKGAITKSQYEREQTSCTAALQQVAAAEARTALIVKGVADGIVRAPFSGEVSAKTVSSGEWVNPGKPLLTLIDVDPLRVQLSVPETLVSKVAVGQQVEVLAVAFPGKSFTAKITRLGGEITATARSMTAEAAVDPGSPLVPGMFVEARVVIGQTQRPVVPENAIVRRGKSWRAFVINDKGAVEERVIQRGADPRAGFVSIAAGVKKGEKLVAPIDEKILDGVSVRVSGAAPAPSAEAPAADPAPAAPAPAAGSAAKAAPTKAAAK
jgi:membrane fusion protein, multidrug efflux system